MERCILHADINNFYAGVECLYNPALRDKPVAVGGDPEKRHGIVLAKNNIAKSQGVLTGETLWEARKKSPNIVFVPPDYKKYMRFSKMAWEIYREYTDRIESFGLDEVWLDVTASQGLFGSGKVIADELRRRVSQELGITISVGVSFNKVFAKLGSDIKKPDATTEIYRNNYKRVVWPLPVGELLYVGPATAKKLKKYNILTIGSLANCKVELLRAWFGKMGVVLWQFANGEDLAPVSDQSQKPIVKSIGNSTTTPKDLTSPEEVKTTFFLLAESVAARLREYDYLCNTVQISVRDEKLHSFERQIKLDYPTCSSEELVRVALKLFCANLGGEYKIRSLGIRACDLMTGEYRQMSLVPEVMRAQRKESLEATVDKIRYRFGHFSIQRGIMLEDKLLSKINPKEDHVIFPVSYFK